MHSRPLVLLGEGAARTLPIKVNAAKNLRPPGCGENRIPAEDRAGAGRNPAAVISLNS